MTGDAPNSTDDRGTDTPPGLPRWLRLLALGLVVVVVVLVVVMLLVGGRHGPGMHRG